MIGERAKLLVDEIDIVLNSINEALIRAQPPYDGRLTIKFENEGAEKLTPHVVKLGISRDQKYFIRRVPSTYLARRAAWRTSFRINYLFVKDLLREAEVLMAKRKEINVKIRQMNHWEVMFCGSNEGVVKSIKEKVSGLHVAVEDNLQGRTTRAEKNAVREREGIQTIVMENKYTVKKKRVRATPPKPREIFNEANDE